MVTVQLIIAYKRTFRTQSIILGVKAKDSFLAHRRLHLCILLCVFSLLFNDWAKNTDWTKVWRFQDVRLASMEVLPCRCSSGGRSQNGA